MSSDLEDIGSIESRSYYTSPRYLLCAWLRACSRVCVCVIGCVCVCVCVCVAWGGGGERWFQTIPHRRREGRVQSMKLIVICASPCTFCTYSSAASGGRGVMCFDASVFSSAACQCVCALMMMLNTYIHSQTCLVQTQISLNKAWCTLSLPQTSRANPVQCYITH